MLHRLNTRKGIVVVSALVITSVVFLIYQPSLSIGFWGDDWTFQEWVGRQTVLEFVRGRFDPTNQPLQYRPLQGILYLLDHLLFNINPIGNRFVQTAIHLGNCLLLFALVHRLSQNWRVGVISGLMYAMQDVYTVALYYISDTIVLTTFFYLLAVWIWTSNLVQRRRNIFLVSLFFVIALLSKEAAVTLPLTLFLVDRLLLRYDASFRTLVKRYIPFVIIMISYLLVGYGIYSNGLRREGYSLFGTHVFTNLFNYIMVLISATDVLSRLALAVNIKDSLDFLPHLWTFLLALVLIVLVLRRRNNRLLLFLGIEVVLNLVVVLGFDVGFFEARYVYLSAAATSVIFALLLEEIYRVLIDWNWLKLVVPTAFVILMLLNSQVIAEASTTFANIARQGRLPFHDVSMRHPSFPADSYLYFVEPPTPVSELSGMFFTRYGSGVIVGGTYGDGSFYVGGRMSTQFARWRAHTVAYVYYFNENSQAIEVPVDKDAPTESSPTLPVDFEAPIQLEQYEITANKLRRGDTLVILLYWRAEGKIEKDYTVFIHLVDADGKILSSMDSLPRDGKERTSAWRANQLTADAHEIPITSDVPVGTNYRIEVGLYYLPTMQRLEIVDGAVRAGTDSIVIGPFSVIE